MRQAGRQAGSSCSAVAVSSGPQPIEARTSHPTGRCTQPAARPERYGDRACDRAPHPQRRGMQRDAHRSALGLDAVTFVVEGDGHAEVARYESARPRFHAGDCMADVF